MKTVPGGALQWPREKQDLLCCKNGPENTNLSLAIESYRSNYHYFFTAGILPTQAIFAILNFRGYKCPSMERAWRVILRKKTKTKPESLKHGGNGGEKTGGKI